MALKETYFTKKNLHLLSAGFHKRLTWVRLNYWLNKHKKKKNRNLLSKVHQRASYLIASVYTRKPWLCLLILSACTLRSGLDIITVWKEKHVWLPLCFPISLAGSGSLSVASHVWPVRQPISPHVANSPNGLRVTGCHKGGASAWLQLADPSPVWLFPTITWTCWYALVLSGRLSSTGTKKGYKWKIFCFSSCLPGMV